jgi:hypothetical protein
MLAEVPRREGARAIAPRMALSRLVDRLSNGCDTPAAGERTIDAAPMELITQRLDERGPRSYGREAFAAPSRVASDRSANRVA